MNMTTTLNVDDFEFSSCDLVERLKRGEDLILCEMGEPIAKVTPMPTRSMTTKPVGEPRPAPGLFSDQIIVCDGFFDESVSWNL